MPILQMVMAIAKYKACIFVATMVVLRVMDAEVACYTGLIQENMLYHFLLLSAG